MLGWCCTRRAGTRRSRTHATFFIIVNRLLTVHEMHASRRLKRVPRRIEEPAQRRGLGCMGRTTAPDAGLVLHASCWHASLSHS